MTMTPAMIRALGILRRNGGDLPLDFEEQLGCDGAACASVLSALEESGIVIPLPIGGYSFRSMARYDGATLDRRRSDDDQYDALAAYDLARDEFLSVGPFRQLEMMCSHVDWLCALAAERETELERAPPPMTPAGRAVMRGFAAASAMAGAAVAIRLALSDGYSTWLDREWQDQEVTQRARQRHANDGRQR
jgi:hypothetical protein